jgi:hypothetical protein
MCRCVIWQKFPDVSEIHRRRINRTNKAAANTLGLFFDPEHGDGTFLRNVSERIPDYAASYSIR